MTKSEEKSKGFGSFSGVFVPTFLSIVGVILFLRLGYIVGEGGILGAITIILIAVSITLATGLALSSITTNIKIGSGGAYSIISKTLGLEIGGSVGIPLYLAQTLSVGLYILGFAETFTFIFPSFGLIPVALVAFLGVLGLTFISTKTAVRTQTFVFGVVCISLVVVFLGGFVGGDFINATKSISTPLIGHFKNMSFWSLFALFFPAVTGLMAGIGMSGELSDPKKQIPKGVLTGLGITTVIYLAVTVWLGYFATPSELIQESMILVKLSAYEPLVLLGILAATFSSALTTFLAAPRVLQALGNNSIIPASEFFSTKESKETPRNALLLTGGIVVASLLTGSLNSIAQVLTVFFLITYMMINVSVFIEQFLALTSFRPTFKIPEFVPLYGAIGSIATIFLINLLAGIVALGFVFIIYMLLVNKDLKQERGDVRSGLFREFSEWSTKKVLKLPESVEHVWKPNILLPVTSTKTLFGNFPLIKAIAHPHGTMTVLGFRLTDNLKENPEKEEVTKEKMEKSLKQLPNLVEKFGERGIFTNFSTVEVDDYMKGVITSLEAIESQVFSPNMLFLPFEPKNISKESLSKLVGVSEKENVGILISDRDEELGLGSEEDVHVWISPRAMEGNFYKNRYFDLAMLLGYSIQRNWNGNLNVWMCVEEGKKEEAKKYLKRLAYEARILTSTSIHVVEGEFESALKKGPEGDIHIIPFEEEDFDSVLKISKIKNRSFLFVKDSTEENILA